MPSSLTVRSSANLLKSLWAMESRRHSGEGRNPLLFHRDTETGCRIGPGMTRELLTAKLPEIMMNFPLLLSII
jgi:hypothetical protein